VHDFFSNFDGLTMNFFICHRLRYGPSLMCTSKREATLEVSTLR